MNELEPRKCKNCPTIFIPKDSTHELCYPCWYELQPKCPICKKLLTYYEKSQKWKHCTTCHYKLFPKTKN